MSYFFGGMALALYTHWKLTLVLIAVLPISIMLGAIHVWVRMIMLLWWCVCYTYIQYVSKKTSHERTVQRAPVLIERELNGAGTGPERGANGP